MMPGLDILHTMPSQQLQWCANIGISGEERGLHGHISDFWRFDFTNQEWELSNQRDLTINILVIRLKVSW